MRKFWSVLRVEYIVIDLIESMYSASFNSFLVCLSLHILMLLSISGPKLTLSLLSKLIIWFRFNFLSHSHPYPFPLTCSLHIRSNALSIRYQLRIPLLFSISLTSSSIQLLPTLEWMDSHSNYWSISSLVMLYTHSSHWLTSDENTF